jgi:hypothetical protein
VASHENSAFTLPVLARAHKDTIAVNEEKSASCSSVAIDLPEPRFWIASGLPTTRPASRFVAYRKATSRSEVVNPSVMGMAAP